jgi:hypothetical protein
MAIANVFYSFHYDNDVNRVQLIRNIGAIAGEQPVRPNEWEAIKKQGDAAVEKWIDDNMKNKTCVVVLIGAETSERKWVKHEIKRAWELKKGLLGIYIHNIKCMNSGTCSKGNNPFQSWNVSGVSMTTLVTTYDPSSASAYSDIEKNLQTWVATAVGAAKSR